MIAIFADPDGNEFGLTGQEIAEYGNVDMTPNDVLAHSYTIGARFVHMMVDDLTPEEFLRQPVPGANSAAWVVGHLALVLRNGLKRRGFANLPAFPAELETQFKATKQAAEEQANLGNPKGMLAAFDACIPQFIEWIRGLSADALAAPPDARIPLATNMAEAIQFGAMHIALHAGQLSTIRRSLGKPPIV